MLALCILIMYIYISMAIVDTDGETGKSDARLTNILCIFTMQVFCLLFVKIYAHEVALNAFNIQYLMLNIQTLTANE